MTEETVNAEQSTENTVAENVVAAEAQPTAEVTPAVETPADAPATETQTAEATTVEAPAEATETFEQATAKEEKPTYDAEALLVELKAAKNSGSTIDVVGTRRIRGGILAEYKGMPLFLPTSHLSLKSNPSENDLLSLIRQTFPVHIHEITEAEKGRVVVTRRRLLRREAVKTMNVGETVEGKVVSVTDFGAFVDIGGVEGMVHVSRISNRRVEKPSDVLKKGDHIRAIIKEVDAAKGKISLSMRELEEDSWKGLAEQYPAGSRHKGTVRSLLDFGAYIELAPSIDGLLHISEMSWARRLKHPSELLTVGQELEIVIRSIDEKKRKISLSLKQATDNPWTSIAEKYPIGTRVTGVVSNTIPNGVVVTLGTEVDAFMPKGKLHPSLRGQKTPFNIGDSVEVLVMDVSAENESLILGMEGFDERPANPKRENSGERRGGNDRNVQIPAANAANKNVSLADLLSEEEKSRLFGGQQ